MLLRISKRERESCTRGTGELMCRGNSPFRAFIDFCEANNVSLLCPTITGMRNSRS